MKKLSHRIAALALTLPLVTAAFTSCGEKDVSHSRVTTDSYNKNDTYDANVYPETEDTDCYPDYYIGNEEYHEFGETGFLDPKVIPLSTFSVDVDTASYTNARRLLEDNQIVPAESVRAEEFINYFDYKYAAPEQLFNLQQAPARSDRIFDACGESHGEGPYFHSDLCRLERDHNRRSSR